MSKRTFFLMLSLLILAIGTTRVWSQSTSDEEALKKLELDAAKHGGPQGSPKSGHVGSAENRP